MTLAKRYLPVAGTVVAWFGSIALAILDIYFVREITFSLLARFKPDYYRAVFVGDVVVVVCGVIVVIYAIWSGEHFIKQANLARTWRVLLRVFGILLLIPIVAYFMG